MKPEARTYYELAAATLKFVFPRPGFLEGIKGRSQAITKMTNVRPCCPLCQFKQYPSIINCCLNIMGVLHYPWIRAA